MRHTILLDSRDRDYDAYPDASEYRVMLPTLYKNIIKARLVSAEIPTSFYVFTEDAGNTTLNIAVAGETTKVITIPDGNYASNSISSTLAHVLTQETGRTFTVSVSRTTRKLTISNEEGTDFTLESSTGPPTGWGLPYYLGFERGLTYTSTGGILESPRLVSLNPYNYILVDIDELNGLDEGGMYGDRVGHGSFAKVPFDAHSFDYVYVNTDNATFPEIILRPGRASVDRLHIKFRFHDGRPVDFRGVENSMMLELVSKEKTTDDSKQLMHSVSSGVSYAVSTAMATAASTAAAAATTAALSVTKEKIKKDTDEHHRALEYSWKSYVRWGAWVLVVAVIAWYIYQKRSATPPPLARV